MTQKQQKQTVVGLSVSSLGVYGPVYAWKASVYEDDVLVRSEAHAVHPKAIVGEVGHHPPYRRAAPFEWFSVEEVLAEKPLLRDIQIDCPNEAKLYEHWVAFWVPLQQAGAVLAVSEASPNLSHFLRRVHHWHVETKKSPLPSVRVMDVSAIFSAHGANIPAGMNAGDAYWLAFSLGRDAIQEHEEFLRAQHAAEELSTELVQVKQRASAVEAELARVQAELVQATQSGTAAEAELERVRAELAQTQAQMQAQAQPQVQQSVGHAPTTPVKGKGRS